MTLGTRHTFTEANRPGWEPGRRSFWFQAESQGGLCTPCSGLLRRSGQRETESRMVWSRCGSCFIPRHCPSPAAGQLWSYLGYR